MANKSNVGHKGNNKLLLIAVVLAVVAAIETLSLLVLFVLCCTKNVALTMKASNINLVPLYNVCKDDVVNEWNSIWNRADAKDSKYSPVQDLRTLADKIKKKPNYQKDSTCQFVIFHAAYYSDDANGMMNSVEAMRNLSKQGNAVNDNMVYRKTIDSMYKVAQSAKKYADKD